ncbi:MAG: MFS transporter [Alphaproteobacteria bacterium]
MSRKLWLAILCGGLIITICVGARASLGLFLKPMSLDLSFGRELFGLAIAIQNLLWGLASPFMGVVADKFGTARVTIAGALFYAGGLTVMGLAGGGASLIFGQILIGLGLSGAGFSTILGAVGRAAPPEKRSVALGIVSACGSLGQFAVIPFADMLLADHGWSLALIGLALLSCVMVPLSAGIAGLQAGAGAIAAQSARAALREAFRHPSFLLLTAGFFVCGFQVVFVATHLPAYLADRAMPAWTGAWALALVGLFNIIGTYGAGVLGGRFLKKNLLALNYFLRSTVFALFLIVPVTETTVLVFAAALGLLWLGTVPLTSGLVAHMFGPTYMSMLYGIVFLSHQVGSFLGAWLGGLAYDLTGSYDVVWWLCIALGFLAALLNWPIAERPVARLAAAEGRA